MPITLNPNILIVGPGALGILFAARLGRRWSGVYLLDHREDRAFRLQEGGLHVTGVTMSDWTPPPSRVRSEVKGWPLMDAVLFFVKAPSFPAAAKSVAPVCGPKTALVVFPEAVDAAALPKGRSGVVLAALTEIRARVEGLGRVVQEAPGTTWLDAGSPAAKDVAAYLNEVRIPASLDKKVYDKRWLTLLAQVCVEVLSALTDAPQKALFDPPLKDLGEKLLLECAAIAKAMRRPGTVAEIRRRRDDLISRAPAAKSPLGRDLLRGRPTERAALLDPLLAAARKAKVPAPFLTQMDAFLRRLEKEGPPA